MKKSFVLLLTLVVMISGTGVYAQNELLQEKDQVHYTERVLYGDKSVVDGVTVEADISYGYYLCWNTKYKMSNAPKTETKYIMYPWGESMGTYRNSGSLWFNMDVDMQLEVGIDDFEKENYHGLELAIKELYDKTEPGTENMVTVYLKDYLEYYNFVLELKLPHDVEGKSYREYGYYSESELREKLAHWEETGTNKDEAEEVRKYLEMLDTFHAFFKIPVLDMEVYTIGIAKDEAGRVIGMSESSVNGGGASGQINIPDVPQVEGMDNFSFNTYSLFDKGDCYFTFNPHTFNDNLVDVSQIPGGYGIYHFTYDKKGNLDLDNLKMVYPLDVKMHISDMKVDESDANLLLFTSDEEHHYMTIIDRETMTLVDTFTIGDSESYMTNWVYDDFIVVRTENLMVYPLGEDGRYTQAFAVEFQMLEDRVHSLSEDINFLHYNSDFDWNGEQLLIVNDIMYVDENLRNNYTCNFYAAVVDESGLVYYAEYDSSLHTNNTDYTNAYSYLYDGCRFGTEYGKPVRANWAK